MKDKWGAFMSFSKTFYAISIFLAFLILSCHSYDFLYPIIINNHIGYINEVGDTVISPQFSNGAPFTDSLAIVEKNGKLYVIDLSGKLKPALNVNNPISKIEPFSEGYSVINTLLKGALFIDESGNIAFNKIFDDALSFSCGFAAVKIDGRWGYINRKGEVAIPCIFGLAMPFSENIAHVSVNRKWGFINTSGDFLVEPKYDRTTGKHSEGLSLVLDNNESKFVNKFGQKMINLKFEQGYSFSEGLSSVIIEGKTCFINKFGEIIIKDNFEEAMEFSEGMAGVKVNGKWGFINSKGDIIIPNQYDRISYYKNGLAKVWINNDFAYINKSGTYVWKSPRFVN
jgi:hypothetical protein